MRTLSIIALIAATASPAFAAPATTSVAADTSYSARDPGDREDRAGIFDTAELFPDERDGKDIRPESSKFVPVATAPSFETAELSVGERDGKDIRRLTPKSGSDALSGGVALG